MFNAQFLIHLKHLSESVSSNQIWTNHSRLAILKVLDIQCCSKRSKISTPIPHVVINFSSLLSFVYIQKNFATSIVSAAMCFFRITICQLFSSSHKFSLVTNYRINTGKVQSYNMKRYRQFLFLFWKIQSYFSNAVSWIVKQD